MRTRSGRAARAASQPVAGKSRALSHVGSRPQFWYLEILSRLLPLPFLLTSGIIRVCLNPAGASGNEGNLFVLMIRLARTGARKQPHYRVVVIEKERARNGRPVEVVGTYNPRTDPPSVELKRDRVDYWVSKGARMSERVGKIVQHHAPAATPAA